MAFATDHLSYQLPAMAGLAHDLLDRCSAFRQAQDSCVGLFAAEIALILEALGGCEQLGIDRSRTDDGAYLARRFADGILDVFDWHSPSAAGGRSRLAADASVV